ncbi:MAG: PepSY domain-containing protein [Gammaproteobacteria bacterium]
MMKVKHATLAGLAALFMLVTAMGSVVADDDHELARRLRDAGDILPLEKILEEARKVHSGHVLEVDLESRRGSYVYDLEILDDQGVVWEMRFDAKTGRLLKEEMERRY